MAFELVSNCRSNEISPVGVKTVLHHEVDVAENDVAEIDRDLFALTRLRSQLMHIVGHAYHPQNICVDGIWMAGALRQGFFRRPDAHAAPVRLALWFPKRSEE